MRTAIYRLGLSATATLALLALVVATPSVSLAEEEEEQHVVRDRRVMVVSGDDGDFEFRTWTPHRGFLGVELLQLTPELRAHFGVPEDQGTMISRVAEDSPAAASGLRAGDILTAVDGEPVETHWDVVQLIGPRQGETVDLEIWRDGRMDRIAATIEERQHEVMDIGGYVWAGPEDFPGVIRINPHLQIDPDTFHQNIDVLRERFDSPEWEERLRHFRERRGDLSGRLEELEERLETLEQEIENLESEDD